MVSTFFELEQGRKRVRKEGRKERRKGGRKVDLRRRRLAASRASSQDGDLRVRRGGRQKAASIISLVYGTYLIIITVRASERGSSINTRDF